MRRKEIQELVKRLEAYRTTYDLSQEIIARLVGVSVFSYSRWVNNRGLPSRQAREKIRTLLRKEASDGERGTRESKKGKIREI